MRPLSHRVTAARAETVRVRGFVRVRTRVKVTAARAETVGPAGEGDVRPPPARVASLASAPASLDSWP